jgi:hypothetical protein
MDKRKTSAVPGAGDQAVPGRKCFPGLVLYETITPFRRIASGHDPRPTGRVSKGQGPNGGLDREGVRCRDL